MNADGGNHRVIMSDSENMISYPRALAVYNKKLYILDPRYDKLERVDVETGNNPQTIIDNQPDLKTFTIFKKRQSTIPCLISLLLYSMPLIFKL